MPDQPQICVRCCPEADGPQTAPGRDSRDFCAFRRSAFRTAVPPVATPARRDWPLPSEGGHVLVIIEMLVAEIEKSRNSDRHTVKAVLVQPMA